MTTIGRLSTMTTTITTTATTTTTNATPNMAKTQSMHRLMHAAVFSEVLPKSGVSPLASIYPTTNCMISGYICEACLCAPLHFSLRNGVYF